MRSFITLEDVKQARNSKISVLGIKPRALTALKSVRINRIKDIELFTEMELLSIPGIGYRSISDIREALADKVWRDIGIYIGSKRRTMTAFDLRVLIHKYFIVHAIKKSVVIWLVHSETLRLIYGLKDISGKRVWNRSDKGPNIMGISYIIRDDFKGIKLIDKKTLT